VAIKKITVAYEQHNENRLFEVWTHSMSSKSFADWKKNIQKNGDKKQGNSSITGTDLARM
jgi:hypothetical protein